MRISGLEDGGIITNVELDQFPETLVLNVKGEYEVQLTEVLPMVVSQTPMKGSSGLLFLGT